MTDQIQIPRAPRPPVVPLETVKAYNDELARLHGIISRTEKEHEDERAEWRKRDEAKDTLIAGMKAAMGEMEARLRRLEGSEAYHDGPSTPPSNNSKHELRRKARSRKTQDKQPAGGAARAGAKPGHPGKSTELRPARRIRHRPVVCGNCGGTRMGRAIRKKTKTITRMPKPKPEAEEHVEETCVCRDCGAVCRPDSRRYSVKGTSIAPWLAAAIAAMHLAPASSGTVRRLVEEAFGLRLCRRAIQNCVTAVAARMRPFYRRIAAAMRRAACIHMDETPMRCAGRQGYVWVAVGKDAGGRITGVYYVYAMSRGAAVIDLRLRFGRPVVVDGYAAYAAAFDEIQRCWAHILREAERDAEADPGPDSRRLLDRLFYLFDYACMDRTVEEAEGIRPWLVEETLDLAGQYRSAGRAAFATTLENAAPNLYTFMTRPGMDPTNNAAERELRRAVIARKIRMSLKTAAGMEAAGILMSCAATWRARGLDVTEAIYGALTGEAAPAA